MQYSVFDLLKLLGSLGLFLFGMKLMSESLQKVAGDKMRSILSAMTSNRFKGILTGFVITAVIQSSSATTVMLVSFVNAGLISFTESIGVVMGANIGTTVTAWLISILGFKVDICQLVLPVLGISLPLLFSKNTNRSNWGGVVIGFAILFIGLDFLKNATPDINSNPELLVFLSRYSDYGFLSLLIFLSIGSILTLIIQSSSAVMALTLVMCHNGWISFDMAAAMVLGENIGTTITANLAALIANVSAKKTALAHFFFNVMGVSILLPLFYPFLHLIEKIVVSAGFNSPFPSDSISLKETALAIPIALSVFHSAFNIINTTLQVWFVKYLATLINRIIKTNEEEEEYKLQFITTGLLSTGELSILQARKEITVYAERVEKMFFHTREILNPNSIKKQGKLKEKILKLEDVSDNMEEEITNYLTKVSEQAISNTATEKINQMLNVVTEIESIADSCHTIAKTIERKKGSKVEFLDGMSENLLKYSDALVELFCLMIGLIKEGKQTVTTDERLLLKELDKTYYKLQQEHFKNLRKGVYKTKTGIIYADILNELTKIKQYSASVIDMLSPSEEQKEV